MPGVGRCRVAVAEAHISGFAGGFGRTPGTAGTRACGLPEMADWLQSAIDDLVGAGEPFALVGNSMGGALAREMVARESSRVRGLALIAPVVDPRRTRRHVAEHVITEPNPTLIHALPQDQTFDFVTMGVNQSFAAWRRYQSYILPGIRLCDRDACARLDARYWLNDDPSAYSALIPGRPCSSPDDGIRSLVLKINGPCCRIIPTPRSSRWMMLATTRTSTSPKR